MSDTPISDRAGYRQDAVEFVVPIETARELERMAGELAEALISFLQETEHAELYCEDANCCVKAAGAALARRQAMKEGK